LVEPKRFDANIAKAEARAAKRAETVKKRKQLLDAADQPAAKRAAVAAEHAPDVPIPAPIHSLPAPAESEKTNDPGNTPDETTDPNDVPDVPLDIDALPPPPTTSLDEYRADRRAVYDAVVTHEPAWKKQTKKRGADRVEPALDDFINAATRQPGDPCYREPVMIFFGNDKTGKSY
jgi:hypothetical protein